ncbi:unnamed protein product [Prorocentrum cordatum]|uniref:Uncharacterized protein n=1 Tax=Prorocentrum cordatum TaxID=2364126 RepID=A0ABN9TP79_9DINO|nr:unnamed protein product [Polarella glacialis]
MSFALASLLICLSAAESTASGAGATAAAASGKRRFLARSQGEGQQCGRSGSDGQFYGDCAAGLACVPPAEGAAPGAPSVCHKVCGTFGADEDVVTSFTCSSGQTCSGKAATPCREWAGECYLYCAGEPVKEEGGPASATCIAMAPTAGSQTRRVKGSSCGTSGSDGQFYGDCAAGLACVPPAEGAAPGAPSVCHKVCGSFGADGDEVTSFTCSSGQTCSGKAATPCREWAGECYLYCDGADRRLSDAQGEGKQLRHERLGRPVLRRLRRWTCVRAAGGGRCPRRSQRLPQGLRQLRGRRGRGDQLHLQQRPDVGSDGHFYGDCSSGLECVPPAEGAALGTPSVCHKVCGSFGDDGDEVTGTCSTGQTCSGKAATPCREWAGECYLYCDGADRRLSDAQGEGKQCGTSGSDGHFYGDCSSGLECVPPAEGAALGTPSVCHKVCGSFGDDGDEVTGTCSTGQTCSGKAATPCREWAGECYLYCL